MKIITGGIKTCDMFEILALIFILILSLEVAMILKCKIGKTIPIVVMGIISIEYVCGYLEHLEWGFYVIMLIIIVSLFDLIRNHNIIVMSLNLNAIVFLIVVLAVSSLHHFYSVATTWDELAQWAVTVKYSYMTNWFAAHEGGNTFYPDYPPATALFHYFWMKVGNGWRDNRLYISMTILQVSFLTPILDEIKEKTFVKTLLIDLSLILSLLVIYPYAYSSLTVDCCIGVIFAYLLYNAIIEKNSKIGAVAFLLGSFVLTSVKKSAPIFVVFALVIWIIKMIVEKNIKMRYWLASLSACLMSYFMWKIYLQRQKTVTTFDISLDKDSTFAMWQIDGVKNFYKCLFKYDSIEDFSQTVFYINHIKVSAFIIMLLLIIGSIYVVKKYEFKLKIPFIFLIIQMVIYTVSISYLYMRSFGEGEVTILSSMNRYLGSYLLGYMLLLLFAFIKYMDFTKKISWIILSIFLISPHITVEKTVLAIFDYEKIEELKEIHIQNAIDMEKANYIKEKVEFEDSRIYLFHGDIAGMNYKMTPYRVTSPLWASGDFDYFQYLHELCDYVYFDDRYGSVETVDFKMKNSKYFLDKNEIYDGGLYRVYHMEELPQLEFISMYKNPTKEKKNE